jgi:hypothetical protein
MNRKGQEPEDELPTSNIEVREKPIEGEEENEDEMVRFRGKVPSFLV